MSSPAGSRPQPAVFLSYAREDAAATRCFANALRAAGVEVWFDENELRGGDAWDRAIRKQIRDCALFVPVISANTQARPEGFFRLEWHLAEQRSLLIAKGRPFIVPVCIDDTPERDALVADAFLTVQWTRLPGGESTAMFVEHIRRLLDPLLAARSGAPGPAVSAGAHAAAPRIPDYELVRLVGRGSYGDVWLARGVTGIWRAIKVVWRDRFDDAAPFEREFKGLKEFAAISLGESVQMALLHVGRNEAAGFFYYVMELADDAERGRAIDPASYVPLTLSELRARRGRLPAAECVQSGVELARVLAGLHGRGLVHRDIKPSNVILVGGVPKLADIGLVAPVTSARTFVGTEGYVPPEGPGAPGADVYALGKVLYELATGLDRQEYPQLPHDLARLPDHRALLRLNEIILRACDPVSERRYRDGAALLAHLTTLQTGHALRGRRIRAFALPAIAALAAVGCAGWWYAHRATSAKAPSPLTPGVPTAQSPMAGVKSIAVLPFEDGAGAADPTRFADGMHEEVLTALGKLSALHVTARAAVRGYADPARRDLRQIGADLGVGAIVEGAIQRIGARVRINVQLVEPRSLRQLWSHSYERDMTDVFALQAAIADDVAGALGATLAPGERAAIARPPTANLHAYELYVQAKLRQGDIVTTDPSLAEWERVARLLDEAVAVDRAFDRAYALLSRVHASIYFFAQLDATPARREKARIALAAAVRLAPADPETRFAQGRFAYACDRDYAAAREHYRAALAGLPNDAELLMHLGLVERRLGNFDECTRILARVFQRNPFDRNAATLLVQSQRWTGHYADAVAVGERFKGTASSNIDLEYDIAFCRYELDGDKAALFRRLRELPRSSSDPEGLEISELIATAMGDFAGALRLAANPRHPPPPGALDGSLPGDSSLALARAEFFAGRFSEAAAHATEARASYEKGDWTPSQRPLIAIQLMAAAVYSGQRAEAVRLGTEVRRSIPSGDRLNDFNKLHELWAYYALLDARDESLECIAEMKRMGMPLAPRIARLFPAWSHVAGDPRFDALVPLPGEARPRPPEPVATATPAPGDKSIVVLPFENFSPDPANAYFTDGLHAEVIAALSRLPDLRVMSRATAETFRNGKTPLAEIGRRLGVADVLSGSVQRDGQNVRVQLELRRASDEALLWQQTFARKLEPGFALQDEIVAEIARILQARSDTGWYSGARFMTKNPRAYELFLQARELPYKQGPSQATFEEQARLCEEALKLDPEFMSGASFASSGYSYLAGIPELPNRPEIVRRAKYWADRASQLVPGGAGDGALSVYYSMVEDDPVRSLAYAKNEVRALPNDANGYNRVGGNLASFGRFTEAVAMYDHALALDPLNYRVLANRVEPYSRLRWLPEFEAAAARWLEFGGKNVSRGEILDLRVRLTGRIPENLNEVLSNQGPVRRLNLLLLARRFDDVLADTADLPEPTEPTARPSRFGVRAVALEALGRKEERVAVGKKMVAVAQPLPPDAARSYAADRTRVRAWALTLAGEGDEAMHQVRRQLELDRAPERTLERFADEEYLARIYAWSGRPKECIELLAKLLREPSLVTVGYLKLSPIWDKVRAEPAFHALMDDPLNSARLGDKGPIGPTPHVSGAAPTAAASVLAPPAAPAAANDKSLAVLPFANLSPDPANAFFAAGLHAEVIATLSRLPELSVLSQATSEALKEWKAPLPQIGLRLGVVDVLSGSVQRDGQDVRVQLELRRARDEALLWEKTFNRKLEPGFALQDEIGAEIARILQARTDVGEYSGAKFMTKHPQAYDLFLEARNVLYKRGLSKAASEEQAQLCEAALKLDPDFMSGASLAASAYCYLARETGHEKGSEIANRAKYWAERASQLVPGGAGDGALSVYYAMVEHDYTRALTYAQNEARALPNDVNGHNRVGTGLMAFGRWTESAAALNRALALDPLNSRVLYNCVIPYAYLRRLPEFEAAVARSLEFGGKNTHPGILEWRVRLTGRLPANLDEVRRLSPADRVPLLLLARDYAAVLADTADSAKEKHADARLGLLGLRAIAAEALGRTEESVAIGKEMLGLAEPLPPDYDGAERMRSRAWALALANQFDAAVHEARRQLESDRAPHRTWDRYNDEETLAKVYAWAGRPTESIELLAKLLREPSLVTVGYLKLSPIWDKVRGEPAFQALLDDPQNSARLGDNGPLAVRP